MKIPRPFFRSALVFFLGNQLFAEDAAKLLEAAENIRTPRVSYEGKIRVLDQQKGKADVVRFYSIKSKEPSISLVQYLPPDPDAGSKVLMVNEDMWVALKSAAQPIRVAARQKMVGNAAYGDITSIDYVKSYTPKFKGKDEFEGQKAVVLDLEAKQGQAVTYDRIEYWLDSENHRPLQAKYMTSSGKILRQGRFENYQKVLGVDRPLTLVLRDELNKDLVTRIELVKAEQKKFAAILFRKESLK